MMLDGVRYAAVDGVFDAKSCLSSVPICVICGEKNLRTTDVSDGHRWGFGGYFFLKVGWMGLALGKTPPRRGKSPGVVLARQHFSSNI